MNSKNLSGVAITPIGDSLPMRGRPQEVIVIVDDGAEIPLHTHDVDATMIVVAGQATVRSADPTWDGKRVRTGDVVEFKAKIAHGFSDPSGGFRFLSRNGGIVDARGGDWDMQMAT